MSNEFYCFIKGGDRVNGSLDNGNYRINFMDNIPSGRYSVNIKSFHMKNFKFSANQNTGMILVSSQTFYQTNTYNTTTGQSSNVLGVVGTEANTNYGGAYESHLNQMILSNSFYNVVSGVNLTNTMINISVTDIAGNALLFTGVPAEFQDFNMVLVFRKI